MKLDPEIFNFLKKLKLNNNRPWFKDNKAIFDIQNSNIKEYFGVFFNDNKESFKWESFKVFRIYKDVRFSKDKTPYKVHFANSYARLGKDLRGGYFLRIRPGSSFLAGGFWEPSKEDLFRIRKEIELDASEIKEVLKEKSFQKYFGGKFESFSELKTAPRGFDKEHPNVALLRKKGFIASRSFTDEEVLSPGFADEVTKSFQAMRPFFNLFSDILTTNLNGESVL